MRVRSMKASQISPCDQAFHLKKLTQILLRGRIIPWILHCCHSCFDISLRIPECWYKRLFPLSSSASSLFSALHLFNFSNPPFLMNAPCLPDHWKLLVLHLGYKEHKNPKITTSVVKHWKKVSQRWWKLQPWGCSDLDQTLNQALSCFTQIGS